MVPFKECIIDRLITDPRLMLSDPAENHPRADHHGHHEAAKDGCADDAI